MFNVLPSSAKKVISKDYRIRRSVVWLTLGLFTLVCLTIFLLPSLVLSYFKQKDLFVQVETMKASNLSRDANTISETIVSTNTKLDLYENDFEYPQVVPIINNVVSQKTSSIKFTDFLYESKTSSDAVISIRGNALTRDSLVSFVRNLENSGIFSEVDLPVSNLAKDRNIDFTVNLIFTKK